jgi:hypothetical protein
MSRASSASAVQVVRAKRLLQVAAGAGYRAAAPAEGRRSGEAVAHWVSRFNRAGLEVLEPGQGGGPQGMDGLSERERIRAAVRPAPDRETEGSATGSLSSLQRGLRAAPGGWPRVSRETLLNPLPDAGWSGQKDRSGCETGKVLPKRKAGTVAVTDRDAEAKKP